MQLLIWIVVLGVIAALGAACYRFFKSRDSQPEQYFRFLCPHCNRKLHYLAHKAGHQGICPRCKQRCTYPMVPHSQW